MKTLEQEQQAEIKVGKIYEAVNEMAYDARQLVYNGITNENIKTQRGKQKWQTMKNYKQRHKKQKS